MVTFWFYYNHHLKSILYIPKYCWISLFFQIISKIQSVKIVRSSGSISALTLDVHGIICGVRSHCWGKWAASKNVPFETKKEQFNPENKAGRENKRKMQIRNCGNETRLGAASFSRACDPSRVHCVTEREWFGTNFERGTVTALPLRLIRDPLTLKCICSTSLITAPPKKTVKGALSLGFVMQVYHFSPSTTMLSKCYLSLEAEEVASSLHCSLSRLNNSFIMAPFTS